MEVLRHRADVPHRVVFGFVIPFGDIEGGNLIKDRRTIHGLEVLLHIPI